MEAVGRLAGGIAHDFNNLLTAITGYSDLLLDRLEPDAEVRRDVEEIRRAAERAGSLTSQLLAFSRRQILAPRVLDLNAAVSETQRLLERLIGEDVELVVDLAPDAGSVRVDPGQLQHALLNLVVNARDAMPAGGRLVIATGCSGPGDRRPDLDLDPVHYAVIRVTDTGCGMDEHVARLAFEPFFTTKEAGTGLGLSMVYGLVKQSGGDVAIETAAGAGTTFTIFLPTPVEAPEAEPPPGIPPAAGGRTVLVAEDEPTVRELVRAVLERAGYTVLVAANGLEALAVAERHPGRIDLLLTDVVMPRLGGRELAERLTGLRPDTKVVLVSGYTDDAGVHEGVSEGGAAFVQKPFTSSTLLARIAEVLAARPAA
jgi:CheY-like chemotaxis protein